MVAATARIGRKRRKRFIAPTWIATIPATRVYGESLYKATANTKSEARALIKLQIHPKLKRLPVGTTLEKLPDNSPTR